MTDQIFTYVFAQWSIHTLYSCFNIAFLVPLNAQINNCKWIEANISPFLLYCNSCTDTLKTAHFLHACLPAVAHNQIVWYHSGMSEAFKEEVVDAFEAGKIWGVCCTDACGTSGNDVWSSLRLRKLRKLLEAQGAMRVSRAYREVIVSARARCH